MILSFWLLKGLHIYTKQKYFVFCDQICVVWHKTEFVVCHQILCHPHATKIASHNKETLNYTHPLMRHLHSLISKMPMIHSFLYKQYICMFSWGRVLAVQFLTRYEISMPGRKFPIWEETFFPVKMFESEWKLLLPGMLVHLYISRQIVSRKELK
jgi:hypothetical protein